MASSARPKRLPNHAYLNGEALEVSKLRTAQGLYNLAPKELFWQARYLYLEDRGYVLRPRYHPGWKPSWIDTNLAPIFCEDSIMLVVRCCFRLCFVDIVLIVWVGLPSHGRNPS